MPAGSRVRIAVMPAPASEAAENSSVTGPVPATAPGASTWTWAAAVPAPAANRTAPIRTEAVVRRAAGQRLVTVQWSSSGHAWFPSRTVAGASPSVPLPGVQPPISPARHRTALRDPRYGTGPPYGAHRGPAETADGGTQIG